MSPAAVARSAARVLHPALDPLASAASLVRLSNARLSDQQRIAIVLQAAGLLSLLERAGWQPPAKWPDSPAVGVGPGSRLVVDGVTPGRSSRPPQELLRDLLIQLFRGEEGETLRGRGAARRAARVLQEAWKQSLTPVPADEAVSQVLEAAPFLWEPTFAPARQALAGELWTSREGGEDRLRLWVAGPPGWRARLLTGCHDLASLRTLLTGDGARALWRREEAGDPRELAASGRWRAAVAAWERHPPSTEEDKVALARTLVSLGLFAGALATLEGTASVASGMVKARCQLLLGQLRAARATLRRLELTALAPGQTVEMAEIAARVYANSGDSDAAAVWVRRALDGAVGDPGGRVAQQARLVAAAAAWDRRDRPAMDGYLAEAEGALAEPGLGWRWHHLRGLRAELDAEGPAMVEHLSRALRASRRLLARHEAAGLWNDLGLGRAQVGDLAGSERAFLHVLRLYGGCDGPRKATLALHNLAEIRLRRGRFTGVREILESSTAENRLSGNVRGLSQDLELWARFELALGRSRAALALCREAGQEMESRQVSWRREETAVLAARALGWLGETEQAAAELATVTQEAVAGQLEPEERPALWAHAGLTGAALEAAASTPFSPLWQALLSGKPVPTPVWEVLDRLEPYRAARLVFDAETLRPAVAPPHRVRAAAAVLRNAGAIPLAERLEARDGGPWEALTAYLTCGSGPEAAAALFAAAGCPEAELVWMTSEGERRVLCPGAGGGHELTAAAGEGSLVLRAPRMDSMLRALFSLLVRDLTGKADEPALRGAEEIPARPVPAGGMVGESPPLKAALGRLVRLAAGELSILILGESGTGKELAARQVHRLSPRSRGQFVAVNCAALSETLLLSDLFGHARGAFTGADRDRAGVFETAHGGTVFLDEIGDLPPVAQGMLLRVLQEGEVRRLGESLPRKVDARVLAATHRDLSKMVREGTFRQDLFYRLKVGTLEMPPLRDRGDDVLLLAEQVLDRLRLPRVPRLSREARARLLEYRWPGNVRELQNVLSVAATLADDGVIGPRHLELPETGSEGNDLAAAYHREVDAVRRRLIEEALEACGGNVAEAARRLGMSRQGLSYLVRTLCR